MTQKSMCERTRSCIVVSALALSLSAGVIVALSSPAAATPRDDRVNEIRELIDRGELARAHALMSELATVTNRSPGELLQRARLESNGPAVEEYLSAALTSASYKRAKERIYLTLALYFQARADLVKLKSILKDYFGEFGRGQYAEEMSQLKIYLSERSSDLSEARRLNRRLEQSSARAATREWAKLNVARYGLENSSSSRNAREA
ncbi:MAG: hypothetical protein ACE5GA_09815, partial [Candidatus Zixiibacteriota bacterium]